MIGSEAKWNYKTKLDHYLDSSGKPLCSLSAKEIGNLLNHGFYYVSTMKVPLLDDFEVQSIRKEL